MTVNDRLSPRPASQADDRLFLRDEELDHGARLLLAASHVLRNCIRETCRDVGLTETEAEILIALQTFPGEDVSGLRKRLGLTTPTLARTLAGLDKRGVIDRSVRDSADARRHRLYLTATGETACRALLEAMRAFVKTAYRSTGPADVAGAKRVLAALVETGDGQ